MSILVLTLEKNKTSVEITTPDGKVLKIFLPGKVEYNKNRARLAFKTEDAEYFRIDRTKDQTAGEQDGNKTSSD